MENKNEGRIEVLKGSWEDAAEGYTAEHAVFEVLPGKKDMGILREACLMAMQEADAAGAVLVNLPSVPNAPEPSSVFQACSVMYAAIKSYMAEHDRPSKVRIFCTDDEAFRLYMVVWNLYYATDKNMRMNDGRWD